MVSLLHRATIITTNIQLLATGSRKSRYENKLMQKNSMIATRPQFYRATLQCPQTRCIQGHVTSLNFANKATISQIEYKTETKLQWKTNRKYLTTPLGDGEGHISCLTPF